ncbi:MAG: hypothetical protein ACP5NF_11745 [Thermoanaerobaculum sp.]
MILRNQAAKLREKFDSDLTCVQVPPRLFHKPPASFPEKLPPEAKIAASHKTLALLVPKVDETLQLLTAERGRIVSEYFLRNPWTGNRLRGFAISEDGTYALLFGQGEFAVFAQGTYVTTVRADTKNATIVKGALHYCPFPRRRQGNPLGEKEELPPLWVRSEVDGSGEEVLLRVRRERLDPEKPNLSEWALGLAGRSDGKLWLVGLSSAEVMLATPEGRILSSRVLPFRFPLDEARQQEDFATGLDLFAQSVAPYLQDATRKNSKLRLVVETPNNIFQRVSARGNDLVLVTTGITVPSRAVLVYRSDDSGVHCFTFDEKTDVNRLAVTDDEIWVPEPFGYYRWGELEELFSPREDKEGKGTRSEHP